MSYEVRVWNENGDLQGYATVEQRGALWFMEVHDVDPHSGYEWPETPHSTRQLAETYAKGWAEGLLEWLTEGCGCWELEPYNGCDAVEDDHGYHIQYCRDDYTVDALG